MRFQHRSRSCHSGIRYSRVRCCDGKPRGAEIGRSEAADRCRERSIEGTGGRKTPEVRILSRINAGAFAMASLLPALLGRRRSAHDANLHGTFRAGRAVRPHSPAISSRASKSTEKVELFEWQGWLMVWCGLCSASARSRPGRGFVPGPGEGSPISRFTCFSFCR